MMRHYYIFTVLLALPTLFFACHDLTPPPEYESGFEGQVYNISHPGPIPIGWIAPPLEMVVTVMVLDGDKQLQTKVQTDAKGGFFVALAPGTYFLSVKESMVPTESGPFTLLPNQRLMVQAYYDNGMR
jgi:hypothetical protein